MPAASFGSPTSTPGLQVIDLTHDSDDNETIVASENGQDALDIQIFGGGSISRTPFEGQRSQVIRERKPQLKHIKRSFPVSDASIFEKPNGKVQAQSAKYRRILPVRNLKHLPSTIGQPHAKASSANCTHDKTNGPTASSKHVEARVAMIPKHQQTPTPVVPRKRKLHSTVHFNSKQYEASSSSDDPITGRKSKVVKVHDRQGKATITNFLGNADSSSRNRRESEDAQMSTLTSTNDSYTKPPDHMSRKLSARHLSQNALGFARKEREAHGSKQSRQDIHGSTNVAKASSGPTSSVSVSNKGSTNKKPSNANSLTSRGIPFSASSKPLDIFDKDSVNQYKTKHSFNLPKSFETLHDDILRLWKSQSCQTSPLTDPSKSTSIQKEPLLGSPITANVLDSSSNKSDNSQQDDDDATGDQSSDTILNGTVGPSIPAASINAEAIGFGDSSLPFSKGAVFSPAECILIIYFKKKMGMSWSTIDQKMGRSARRCMSKWTRSELDHPHVQRCLRYHECLPVIESMEAANCSLQETLRALTIFLNMAPATPTAKLPKPSNTEIKGQQHRVIQDEASENSGEEHEYQEKLQKQPFKRNFPPLGNSKDYQDYDSDEGPRLRRRSNLKHYTFTKADFGYYSDEELPASVSLVDSETEPKSKILQSQPTGLRAVLFENDLESDQMSLRRPYLSIQERQLIRNELRDLQTAKPEELRWDGIQLHVPMTNQELSAIQSSIAQKANINFNDASCLYKFLKSKSAAFLRDVAFAARKHPDLSKRSRQSIEAFLNDASRELAGGSGLELRFVRYGNRPLQSSLLQQELGEARNARTVRCTVLDSLQPALSFTGTSGDVGTVAWSPNGHIFAAGSACLVDENSMQYNRRNNLLLGDFDKQLLVELPHHATKRVRPAAGPNSTDAMHVTQDPRLFETVSMLDFSPDGNYLYSVGYDNFLRAYHASQQSSIEPIWSYNHCAKVDLLAVSSSDQQLLATGCQIIDTALNIFRCTENGMERLISLSSNKANLHTDRHIFPSTIKWGKHPLFRNHLLAGFSSTSENTKSGEICMYDVTRREPIQMIPASGNVFDCAWSQNSWYCAAACTAISSQVNRKTKSQVFIYQPEQAAFKSNGINLESSALDINDVIFCPYDYNYVAAGATDGKVYVWDIRRPDYLLHLFSHGTPLMELDGSISRAHIDTGVRFCAWGYDRTRLFSGSSDGVVKTWHIHRSPEDAHMQDVVTLNSGIMSGAFNSDFTKLLLGEVNGSITVLEAGNEVRSIKEVNKFQLRQADDTKAFATMTSTESLDLDSGVALGRALRKSKQIKFKPLGSLPVRQAVQGREYRGPHDLAPDSEQLRTDAAMFQARMKPIDKENMCKIPLCHQTNNFITQEEAGDSGRSADRIPQAIRDAISQEPTDQQTMICGMLKCSHCHRPARPRIGDASQELFPLCERCGFECFRCGKRAKIDHLLTVVKCRNCSMKWRTGAIGYKLTKQPRSLSIGSMGRVTTRTEILSEHGGGLEDLGDMLHLVEDYYQSLWEEKPPADA